MKLILLFVALSAFRETAAEAPCEVCDLKAQIDDLKIQLGECKDKLREFESNEESSYLGRVCQWVAGGGSGSSATSKNTLKKTVANFLRATNLDAAKVESNFGSQEVKVTLSVSNGDLITLRRFVLNDEGGQDLIQDILTSSFVHVERPGDKKKYFDLRFVTNFLQNEGFVICQIVAISAFVALALWKKVKVWRIASTVFVGSVAWTWIHLYKVALSRKQATLTKLGEIPQKCLVEKQGWMSAMTDAVKGMVGVKDSSKCEAYYEALMVDPFWEVTPLKALTETLSQFVLRPLEMFGGSVGVFFTDILAPVPLVWKVPVLIVGAVIIVMIVLMACRYKIKSPLLFSIEPCSNSPLKKKKLKANNPDSLPYPANEPQLQMPSFPPSDQRVWAVDSKKDQ